MTSSQTGNSRSRLKCLQVRLEAALRDLHEIRDQMNALEDRDPLAELRTTLRRRSRHLPFEALDEESLN